MSDSILFRERELFHKRLVESGLLSLQGDVAYE